MHHSWHAVELRVVEGGRVVDRLEVREHARAGLHEAPCSILIARPATSAALFPMNVVVGIDGSPSSLEALSVREYASHRFGVPLRTVLACHGDVDIVHAELKAPTVEIVDDTPVDALVDAAAASDLLIVGNRGLRTLGSVSERVAHKALSSVLVVRVRPDAPQ